jgi:hypothetical protein
MDGMIIKCLLERSRAVMVMGLLILALTLAACGSVVVSEEAKESDPAAGADAATSTEAEAPEETETTQETEATQAEATEETQAAQETEEAEAEVAQAQPVSTASCEPVVIPDNERIAAPSENDWAKGPETASVTVIEYGDFQ